MHPVSVLKFCLIASSLTIAFAWDKSEYIREECGLELPRDKVDLGGYFEDAYYGINKSLRKKYPATDTTYDIFYAKVADWLSSIDKLPYKLISGQNTKRSLILLNESNHLDDRPCDRCTYLIAKGNCDASARFGGCYKSAQVKFILGKALGQRVVRVAQRCALPEHEQVATRISKLDGEALETVTRIANALVDIKKYGDWPTIEKMFLEIDNPSKVKLTPPERLIVDEPDEVLAELMLDHLDKDKSLSSLLNNSKSVELEDIKKQFDRLVAEPCRKYREELVIPSQTATFYMRLLRLHGKLNKDQDLEYRRIYYPMLAITSVCNHLVGKAHFYDLRKYLREKSRRL